MKKEFPPYDKINFNDEQFIKNKNITIPKSLFKYTKIKYAKNILLDDLMYLPRIYELNDPYEGELLYNSEKIIKKFVEENLDDFIKEILKNDNFKEHNREDVEKICELALINIHAPRSLDELKKYIKNYVNIICLSKTNKINSLWAHYADNHQGICIEYNILKNAPKIIKDFCFEIEYVELSDDTNNIKEYFEENYLDLNLMIKPLLKKSKDWSYEEEWRIILHDQVLSQNHENFYSDKHYIRFIKPTAVYMGFKISPQDEDLIKDICKFRNIELYKSKKDNKNYKFEFEKINPNNEK